MSLLHRPRSILESKLCGGCVQTNLSDQLQTKLIDFKTSRKMSTQPRFLCKIPEIFRVHISHAQNGLLVNLLFKDGQISLRIKPKFEMVREKEVEQMFCPPPPSILVSKRTNNWSCCQAQPSTRSSQAECLNITHEWPRQLRN